MALQCGSRRSGSKLSRSTRRTERCARSSEYPTAATGSGLAPAFCWRPDASMRSGLPSKRRVFFEVPRWARSLLEPSCGSFWAMLARPERGLCDGMVGSNRKNSFRARHVRLAPVSGRNKWQVGSFVSLSIDLEPESFHDRLPESNIGREGPPEFFGACVERWFDTGVDQHLLVGAFSNHHARRLRELFDDPDRCAGRCKQPNRSYHGEAGEALFGSRRKLRRSDQSRGAGHGKNPHLPGPM